MAGTVVSGKASRSGLKIPSETGRWCGGPFQNTPRSAGICVDFFRPVPWHRAGM